MSRKQGRKTRRKKVKDANLKTGLAVLSPLLPAICLVVVLIVGIFAMEHLRDYVYSQPQFNPRESLPPEVKLVYGDDQDWIEQEGWEPLILSVLNLKKYATDPQYGDVTEEELVTTIGRDLIDSGWVREKDQVKILRDMDGTISVHCRIRRPIAMLHVEDGKYVAIDEEGVRLPKEFLVDENAGWLRIFGVESGIPAPGQPFKRNDRDAMAAVRLAGLIFQQEETAARISSIDVSNYGGRRDKRNKHILLRTRDGLLVAWGSAIGEEVEEANVSDKLRNLVMMLKQHAPQASHDSGRSYVDLSTYKYGWIEGTGQ